MSCIFSPFEIICLKCQNLITVKNKKKYFIILSTENFTQIQCSLERQILAEQC